MEKQKVLSADGVFQLLYRGFGEIGDHRAENRKIPLVDALMSGFALFSLKDASLLEFDERRATDGNLKRIYGLGTVPSDSQMRTILDPVSPKELKPLYKTVFEQLERSRMLEKFVYLGQYYLLSLDGTEYFSSTKVHCPACLEKKTRKKGELTYRHQLLGGAIVHPDLQVVIPLVPEPIIKQDGQTKNDCERNAAKRFLAQVRQDHPDLPLIIIEDALSANAPHIKTLQKHKFRFILGVKEGDHAFLFDTVRQAHQRGETTEYEYQQGGTTYRFCFINQVPLNASNQDILVNFLEYWEIKGDRTLHFSWITDFTLSKLNLPAMMNGCLLYTSPSPRD